MMKPPDARLILKLVLIAMTAAAALIGAALLAVPSAQEGLHFCPEWCLGF